VIVEIAGKAFIDAAAPGVGERIQRRYTDRGRLPVVRRTSQSVDRLIGLTQLRDLNERRKVALEPQVGRSCTF